MAKFSELFTAQNVPYQCIVTELKPRITTKYGEKALVKLVHEGTEYEWFASPASYNKNIASNGINPTDVIEVMQVPSTGSYPMYTFKKLQAGEGSAAAITPAVVNQTMDERNKAEEMKNNRILLQGLLQALVNSGKFGIEECKKLTTELSDFVLAQADEMYAAKHDPTHLGKNL